MLHCFHDVSDKSKRNWTIYRLHDTFFSPLPSRNKKFIKTQPRPQRPQYCTSISQSFHHFSHDSSAIPSLHLFPFYTHSVFVAMSPWKPYHHSNPKKHKEKGFSVLKRRDSANLHHPHTHKNGTQQTNSSSIVLANSTSMSEHNRMGEIISNPFLCEEWAALLSLHHKQTDVSLKHQ